MQAIPFYSFLSRLKLTPPFVYFLFVFQVSQILPVHPCWLFAVLVQLYVDWNGPFLHSKEAVLEASSEATSEEAVQPLMGPSTSKQVSEGVSP